MKRSFFTPVCGLVFLGITSLAAAQSSGALVDKYTALAGSKQNAQQLVDGLRKGGDFKLGTESIDNANGKLGNGEVNIALSLVQADMRKNQLTFQAALEDILKQRAAGGGWGEIANSMGVKLGELVRSDKARHPDRMARADRHLERPDRVERAEKPERPERPDRPEKPERAAR